MTDTKAKPVVALFTSSEGHVSIAQAIAQALEKKYTVRIFEERDGLFDLYTPVYQLAPSAFKFIFHVSKREKIAEIVNQYFLKRYRKKITQFVKKTHPDILINTYYMYNSCLEELAETRNIPFINVLTDPKTIHPMLISELATTNITFNEEATVYSKKLSPKADFTHLGWMVRKEYSQPYDIQAVREKLDLKKDLFTLLLVSGSEGTNIVIKILPSLISAKKPLQIVVACGSNKTLFQSVKTLAMILRKTKSRHSLVSLAFTHQLHLYMQAADLVIGKAGPNTVFEAVATRTPFFAITHISGQEDGNLDIIRDLHLGYVEENPFRASRMLKKIINQPEDLKHLSVNIKKLATYNDTAQKKLLELVEKKLTD